MKKYLTWIIPLLVVAAVAFALIRQTASEQPPVSQTTATTSSVSETTAPAETAPAQTLRIFWNIDRAAYTGDNAKAREAVEGLFPADFAVDGERITLYFGKKTLLTFADSMEYMGIVYDENNLVSQILDVESFTGGLGAYQLYVEAVSETEILCNTLSSFDGLPLKLYLNDNSRFYLIGDADSAKIGTPAVPVPGCQIIAILGTTGFVDTAYIQMPT